jgi:brefeldin A-inhibited guanine nucleotide-exchange protein
MHVFISRALHKILREAPKKHTQLRAACQEVIEELKKNGADMFPPPDDPAALPPSPLPAAEPSQRFTLAEGATSEGDGAEGADIEREMEGVAEQSAAAADAVQGGETERYFLPLRLACESKVARVMEVALHCIQKLIAYGYVRGKIVMVGNVKKWLVDVVMDTVMLRPPRPCYTAYSAQLWGLVHPRLSLLTPARADLQLQGPGG